MFIIAKFLKYKIKGKDHNSILIHVSTPIESSSGPQDSDGISNAYRIRCINVKVKQSLYRPGQTVRVPGS